MTAIPRRTLLILALLLLPLAPAGCEMASLSEKDEIVFGLAAPLGRSFGDHSRLGAELAVRQINERGGIGGRTLVLRLKDDETDAKTAIQVATELGSDAEVIAVIGHANSGPMVAAAPEYDRHQLPALATSATSPEITHAGPWVFRIASSDSANAVMMAREAHRMSSNIAILYSNEDYGRGLARVFRRALEAEGARVSAMDPYLEEMEDFTPYVDVLKHRGVDLVLIAGLEIGASKLIRQAEERGLEARFMGGDGLESLVDMGAGYDGALVGMLFHPDATPRAQAFAQEFRAAYSREPESSAATAYDAVMLLARAVGAGHDTRERMRAYLEQVGRPGGSPVFDGVAGPVAFDEAGDPREKPFVLGELWQGTYRLFAGGR